jgi:hypothetical protein
LNISKLLLDTIDHDEGYLKTAASTTSIDAFMQGLFDAALTASSDRGENELG